MSVIKILCQASHSIIWCLLYLYMQFINVCQPRLLTHCPILINNAEPFFSMPNQPTLNLDILVPGCDFWFVHVGLYLDTPPLSDCFIESTPSSIASPRTSTTAEYTLAIPLLALLQHTRSYFLIMLPLSWHKKQKPLKTLRKHRRKGIVNTS